MAGDPAAAGERAPARQRAGAAGAGGDEAREPAMSTHTQRRRGHGPSEHARSGQRGTPSWRAAVGGAAIALAALLTACGGGSSSGPPAASSSGSASGSAAGGGAGA